MSTPHRNRLAMLLAGLVCITLTAAPAAAQTEGPRRVTRLGGSNAFHRPPVTDGKRLQRMFVDHRDEILDAMSQSGWTGNVDDLFAAIASGAFTEGKFAVGDRLQWMAMKKNKKPTLLMDLAWHGKEPFEMFEVTFISNKARHTFVIPELCGNLAFKGSVPLPKPIVNVAAMPASDCVTRTFTIDASKSSIAEGKIASLTCEESGPGGKHALGAPASAGSYVWTKSWREPGTYTFTCRAASDQGIESDPASASVEVRACPPTANVKVTIPAPYTGNEVYTGDMFMVDGSGSKAQVGEIAKVYVDVLDADGAVVRKLEMPAPFSESIALDRAGMYTFRAVAEDTVGQRSEPVETTIEIWSRVGIFVDGMAGTERRWREGYPTDRSAPLVGVKAGPFYRVSPHFEVATGLGFALNTRDVENSTAFADVELNYIGSRAFFGAGVGAWDFTDVGVDDGTATGSVFLHGGVNLRGELTRTPLILFVEGRALFDHIDMLDNNYVVWAGIRTYR